ncbi:MAG TPA: STAS domain-containing protein [Thermoleophilaceae bacterium]|jgi:anti-anti-sigma factor
MDELARIEIDQTPRGVIARISGEIDISNVGAVKRKLTDAVTSASPGLVVDVSGTTYLDSSGVYLLFELARALEGRQQQMCVVAPPTTPSTRVLLITGFDHIVPVTGTVEEAIEKVGPGAPAASA